METGDKMGMRGDSSEEAERAGEALPIDTGNQPVCVNDRGT